MAKQCISCLAPTRMSKYLMFRWTNDEYLSTKHRVIKCEHRRYLNPVFFGPNGDAVIEAMPACRDPRILDANFSCLVHDKTLSNG
jgi:isopenicillin N synthase-like dioxygenase